MVVPWKMKIIFMLRKAILRGKQILLILPILIWLTAHSYDLFLHRSQLHKTVFYIFTVMTSVKGSFKPSSMNRLEVYLLDVLHCIYFFSMAMQGIPA